MIEDLWLVLPLRAIVFQTLLLLIAIAIESIALQRILNISRKTAIQYSAILNLLSTFIGWLCFFVVQSITPGFLANQLIRYIFFDRFVAANPLSIFQNGFYFLVFRIFLMALDLTIEIIGLDLLLNFVVEPTAEIKHLISSKEPEAIETKLSRLQKFQASNLNKLKFQATFWANFISNIFISILIVAII